MQPGRALRPRPCRLLLPMGVLLASGSPQRRSIFTQLGIPFRVEVPEVDELDAGAPVQVATDNAAIKARAMLHEMRPGEVVVGCDTLLDVDGEVWGKPANVDDAERMLRSLRGRTHVVVSGVHLASTLDGELAERTCWAATSVTFRDVRDVWLATYLAGGEWAGRAGGYAIQGTGAALIDRIEGDYLNVVGFPVAAFLDAVEREPWLERIVWMGAAAS